MNFYNQYKDLFQVGNISFGQRERLRLDNQLFIDRPFVPAYSKEYELSSKLRELNRDYNDFESQVRELQELSEIPKRSQSRKKQNYQNTKNNQPVQNSHIRHRKGNSIEQNYMQRQQNNLLNAAHIKKHYQKSTIFDQYQDNQSQNVGNHHKHKIDQRQSRPKQQQQYKYQKRQQYNMQSSLPQKYVQSRRNNIQYEQKKDGLQHQQRRNHNLQQLRRENDMNAQKLINSQNILANKMYQEQNNNILKQSEINHVFNWKLQQQQKLLSPQQIKQTTIPKYKLNNPTLQVSSPNQYGNNKGFRNVNNNNNNNNWNEGNSRVRVNERRQNIQQRNNYPSTSNQQMSALQRRRIAKQKIDQRRQKLKNIIKSYF